MKTTCLSCKFCKIVDTRSGYCRATVQETGDRDAQRPAIAFDHHCDKWSDAGQQYFIRLGWLRSQEAKEEQA